MFFRNKHRMKYWYWCMLQNGWTLKTLCEVKRSFTKEHIFWNSFCIHTQSARRDPRKASHSRLVGGRFNKQGNLQVFSWAVTRCTDLYTGILKVYLEDLNGFSHIYHWEGLGNTWLSQSYVCPWNSSYCSNSEKNVHSREGLVRSLWFSRCSSRINQQSLPLNPLFHLCEMFRRGKSVWIESRLVFA